MSSLRRKGLLRQWAKPRSQSAPTHFSSSRGTPAAAAQSRSTPEDARKLNDLAAENRFAVLLAHTRRTRINPCSASAETRTFALETMRDDLQRLEATPHNLYNFHPGSHVGQGVETGIAQIADTLNQILLPEQTTTVLLETMAGKGSEVGSRF